MLKPPPAATSPAPKSALLAPAYFLKTVKPTAAEILATPSTPNSSPLTSRSEVSQNPLTVQKTRAEGLITQKQTEEINNGFGSGVNVVSNSESLPSSPLSRKMNEKYAGPSFLTAPLPGMIPKPQFSTKASPSSNPASHVKNFEVSTPQSLVQRSVNSNRSALRQPLVDSTNVAPSANFSSPSTPQQSSPLYQEANSFSAPPSPEIAEVYPVYSRSFSRSEVIPTPPRPYPISLSGDVPSEGSLPPSPSNSSPVASPPRTPGSMSPPTSRPSSPPYVEPIVLDGGSFAKTPNLTDMTNELKRMLNLGSSCDHNVIT